MSTKARQYPRKAWVLMPSFKPKEVTLVGPYSTWKTCDWEKTDSGKSYHLLSLFESQKDAIAEGRKAVLRIQADITKRQANLDNKVASLDKAEKESK